MEPVKKELRAECRKRSAALSREYRESAGAAIRERVLSSPEYRQAGTIFIYVSMETEPDTLLFIDQALADGKRVFSPRCGKKPFMEAAEIKSRAELRPGKMGIPAPGTEAMAIRTSQIDLALIPCVAAGEDCSRLGHGAGYYDAFLKNTEMKKICLCFDSLVFPSLPMEEGDVFMDRVVTESRTIWRGEKTK